MSVLKMRDSGPWFPVLRLGLATARNCKLFQIAVSKFYFGHAPSSPTQKFLPTSSSLKSQRWELKRYLAPCHQAWWQSISVCIPGVPLYSKGAYYAPDCPLTLEWLIHYVHTSVFFCEAVSLQSSGVAMAECAAIAEGRSISSPSRWTSNQSTKRLHQSLTGM